MSETTAQKIPSPQELLAAGLSEDQVAAALTRLGLHAGRSDASLAGGVDIVPTPAFVVKTVVEAVDPSKLPIGQSQDASRALCCPGTKVFVNLCSHEAMPGIKNMNKPRPDGQGEEEGIHVPVAVGPLKPEKDNAGSDGLALDLVVHPSVIVDCDRDASGAFRHWLVQVALQYVQRKHGLTCNAQYALPKTKYKGETVTGQRIRSEKTAKIEEVKSEGVLASVGSPSPLGILSEAGALPQQSTALAMPQRGLLGSKASSSRPSSSTRPELPVRMDMRILSEEREAEREGLVGKMARQAAEAVSGLAISEDVRPGAASLLEKSSNPALGLSVASTRRLPTIVDVEVAASLVDVQDPVAQVNADSEEKVEPIQTSSVDLLCAVDLASAGPEERVVSISLPAEWSRQECTLHLIISFPGKQEVDYEAIKLTGKGSGDKLTVKLPGFRSASIKLPFRCSFVAGAGLTTATGPSTIPAQWKPGARQLSIALPRRVDAGVGLPALPNSLGSLALSAGLPADVASILLSYVAADMSRFEPDPGSRPWLLAQALSSDDSAIAPQSLSEGTTDVDPLVSNVPGDGSIEEELPEDALLRQDALSMHFLMQRQAEKEARKKKDEARSLEPMVKEITFEPGVGQVETPADLGTFGTPATAASATGPGTVVGGRGAAAGGNATPVNIASLLEDLM